MRSDTKSFFFNIKFVECESGKYGLNCHNSCGKCQKDAQCHNVNGSCLQGCSPGHIGPFCNICKYIYILCIK